jgi:hypothetical protein
VELDLALAAIPAGLRVPLIEQFVGITRDYRQGNWEGVGTKSGKLCEVVYSVLEGITNGAFPAAPKKPQNMVQACNAFEPQNKVHGRNICIQIPKVLIAVYEIRNNRAIGHIDANLNPNRMDAEFCLRSMKWTVAELVRHFSGANVASAHRAVEHLTLNYNPIVWEIDGKKRVLNTNLGFRDQILVLLYGNTQATAVNDLVRWTEYSNSHTFKKKLLPKLHHEKVLEYNALKELVTLSPLGEKEVESRDLLGDP